MAEVQSTSGETRHEMFRINVFQYSFLNMKALKSSSLAPSISLLNSSLSSVNVAELGNNRLMKSADTHARDEALMQPSFLSRPCMNWFQHPGT